MTSKTMTMEESDYESTKASSFLLETSAHDQRPAIATRWWMNELMDRQVAGEGWAQNLVTKSVTA